MASLDSVRQKIFRAAEHFKALETELERYFETHPGEVVREPDNSSNLVPLRFRAKKPVPAKLPLIIGDCLQNVRSSLDYLVWELVLAAGNQPTQQNMFPICDSPEGFNVQLERRRLDGVSPEAVAEIEGFQPYHHGQNWKSNALFVLDNLCNINKHRRVLLTDLGMTAMQAKEVVIEGIPYIETTIPMTDQDTQIGFVDAGTNQVQVEGHLFAFIKFNEGAAQGKEITTCLNAILWHVNEHIVPRFERFFR